MTWKPTPRPWELNRLLAPLVKFEIVWRCLGIELHVPVKVIILLACSCAIYASIEYAQGKALQPSAMRLGYFDSIITWDSFNAGPPCDPTFCYFKQFYPSRDIQYSMNTNAIRRFTILNHFIAVEIFNEHMLKWLIVLRKTAKCWAGSELVNV